MTVTIFIPISRPDHLERLFHALEILDCDASATNIFTYVDGNASLFLKARNLTEESKFANRLCLQRPGFNQRNMDLYRYFPEARRFRIAAIHNEAKELVGECTYVFGLEDDSIPPPSALRLLLAAYAAHPFAGIISGVEVGRWGVKHLGLWIADDVYDPVTISSPSLGGAGVSEVDACGFYTFLTKAEYYKRHEFKPFGNNALGPDVDYGLSLRQQGFKNYVVWNVHVEHRLSDGTAIKPSTPDLHEVKFTKQDSNWHWKIVN